MKCTGKHRQSGNMILYLFGAIAVAGVLTSVVGGVVQGPLNLAATKHRTNTVETQLSLAAKAAAMAATKQPSGGDCDGDSFVEPVPYQDAGASPKPTGGGLLPMTIGAARKDPWGVDFGYCVFDHGPVVADAGCGGVTQKRLNGTNQSKWDALAVISAGPDGTFQTACNAWVDTTPADNQPDTPMVNKPGGSDDIVFTWTFAEASAATGGLWALNPGDPNLAEISMNLGVKDTGGTEQLSFDAASKELLLGTGGVASFPTAKADYLAAFLGAQINLLNDMDITGSYSFNGTEIIDEDGMIVSGEQDPKLGTITDGKWCVGVRAASINWAEVSGGLYHTCGRKTDGTLWCWGKNDFGQIGDGTTTQRNSPVQIGVATDWAEVSSGGQGHSCARKTDGTLWCWGKNDLGQIGDGTNTQRTSPVQVGIGTNWAKVSASGHHACGRKTDGTIWCWGYNGYGELGDGSTTARNSPVQVGVGTNWADVDAGSLHTCGRKTDGTIWCWGYNMYGQIGNGTTSGGGANATPIQVGVGTNWAQVAAHGNHSCGRQTDSTLWCWGYNLNGFVGDGTTTNRTSPVSLGPAMNSADVSGDGNSCARKADGTLWCWGWNGYGQIGDGTTTQRNSPVQVGVATSWAQFSTGAGGQTCSVRTDGTLWCWGRNLNGQLGLGDTTDRSTPVDIGGITPPPPGTIDCTADGPGISTIQTGVTGDAVLAAGCSTLGELKKDTLGNLLVCDDNTSAQIPTGSGTCTGFEPGSLTFDKDGALYACGNADDPCLAGPIGTVCESDGAIYIGDMSGNRIYAAPADEATMMDWKTTLTTTPGTLSTTDGLANTNAIIADDAGAHPAGNTCYTKVPGGTWYLPAKDELNLVWTNRTAINLAAKGFNTGPTFYWTSTQHSSDPQHALNQRFDSGVQDSSLKNYPVDWNVRCVRR